MKTVSFILIWTFIMASCSKDSMPYENAFRNTVVRNTKIEPLIESITIDAKLDSNVLYEYFRKELKEGKEEDMVKAKEAYEYKKGQYELELKYNGKNAADIIYGRNLETAKKKYDDLVSGERDSLTYQFYFERLKSPTIFEQITVRFRLKKEGELIVGRFRTDIFKGDTSFYELRGNSTIEDYIK